MSGGSFNYLFAKDASDLLSSAQGDLASMVTDLASLGYAEDAAKESEELLCIMRQFEVRANVRMRRLAGVWRAMEWWRSCDGGEDGVQEALAEYRGGS